MIILFLELLNTEHDYKPQKLVINKEIMNSLKGKKFPEGMCLQKDDVMSFLGESDKNDREFIRALVNVEKEGTLIFLKMTTSYSIDFVKENQDIKRERSKNDKYIFLVNIFYRGNREYEMTTHGVYKA